MLNKYFLFGFLVIIGALASSAFTFVSQKPVQNKLVSIVETGFRTPLTSDYAPAIAEIGFKTPQTSDYAPAIAVTGFRTPQSSNYVESISEVASHKILYYEYGPLIAATGSAAMTGFRTPQTSDYAPSIGETGFRTPQSSNYVESISEVASHKILYYEYGPLSAATGPASPK